VNSRIRSIARLVAFHVVFLSIAGCNYPETDNITPTVQEESIVSQDDIAAAIAAHSMQIMQLDDVAGIGEGLCEGSPCVKVLLTKDNPATRKAIQTILNGIPAAIETSGSFSAS